MSDELIKPEEIPAPDPLKDVKAKLTDDEKEAFFKAFVSDQPYTEVLTTFGGKVKVAFRTLTVDQNNTILQQQRYDITKGIAHNDDQYLIRVIQYRIAAALVSIDGEAFAPDINATSNPPDEKAGTTYIIKRIESMIKWPTFKLSNVTDAFNRFERKVMALTEESFKESF